MIDDVAVMSPEPPSVPVARAPPVLVRCVMGIDATMPCASLGFLKYKVFLVHVSNVHDDLPTDEVAQPGGRTYRVRTRAYLDDATVAELAESVGATASELPALAHEL